MPAQLDRFASLDDRARFTLATCWQRDGLAVTIHESDPGTAVETYARQGRDLAPVQVRTLDADTMLVSIDGIGVPVTVHLEDDIWCISDGEQSTQWRRLPRHADTGLGETSRGPSTPVPGTVTMVNVVVGDHVEAGDCLVVLEAMKMEHRILADVAGVIAEVRVAVGDSVDAHTVVAELAESSTDSSAQSSGEQ
jgi:acetyl/propionyl-CoA carboxylase alpha subunit